MKRLTVLLVAVLTAVVYGCAAHTPVNSVESGAASSGAELYARYCSSCHGSLTRTDRPGRRAARIKSAIQHNIGGMGYLSVLKDGEIKEIADELALVVPPKEASGDELYGLYCANCHGPLDQSEIAGKTLDDIMQAASRNVCSASNMKYLGEKEISKIVQSLSRKRK